MTSQPGKQKLQYIAKYFEKLRQSDNEIWSVNRMYYAKYFS